MNKVRTLREHIEFVRNVIWKKRTFYQKRGLEISATVHTLLWQNRRYIVDVTTRALMSLTRHGDDSPRLKEWRSTSQKNHLISRIVQYELITQKSASLSRLAAAAEHEGSRESVRRALKIAVDIGLLERTGDQYSMSKLYVDELFDLTTLRLRDPEVVEFARLVLAINQTESILTNPKFPRNDEHPLATPLTLTEEIVSGSYTENNEN